MQAGIAQSLRWLGYSLDNLGFNSRPGQVIFIFSRMPRPGLGSTQHPILCTEGGSIPGVKHLQCEVNHSLTVSAKIKNRWSYNSIPPIRIHSMDMDNFTSTLICVRTSVIYTAATGSLCTSISSIGRLDTVWSLHPYHVTLHSYTIYQEISHQIYFCTYYYFWWPKMWHFITNVGQKIST